MQCAAGAEVQSQWGFHCRALGLPWRLQCDLDNSIKKKKGNELSQLKLLRIIKNARRLGILKADVVKFTPLNSTYESNATFYCFSRLK